MARTDKEISMRKTWLIAPIVVGGLLIVGCEKSETKSAAPAAPAVPATPQSAAPATPAAPAIPPPPDTAKMMAATTQAAGTASAEAQKLLDQAVQYIKDNKLDLADKTLTQVEGMKSSLSPAMQKQVDSARSMLNAAKAGGGIKIPPLGGK
jgi:hypothetical protein